MMSVTRPTAHYAIFALIVLSAIWGYNWVVMKEVLKYSGPFDFAALRTVLGALALFVVLLWQRKKPIRPVAFKSTLLLGLLQTTAFTGLIQWALVNGGAGKTAVLAHTMPFWVLLLAWPLLNERVRGWQWPAIALAMGGLILILEPWQLHGTFTSHLLAVSAGLAWAASAIVAKRLRSRMEVDLLSLTAWQMLLGSAVLVAIAWLVPSKPIAVTGYFIGALLYSGILATAAAWLLWLFVLHSLPVGIAGLSSLAVPTVGVLAAWISLGETPTDAEFAGMLLIAIALAILSALGMLRRQVKPALSRQLLTKQASEHAQGRDGKKQGEGPP